MCVKFWMLDGKMGNFGAKKHGFDWQQGYGGGALVKAPKEKWGKMGKRGEKWGKMENTVGNFGCSMEIWRIWGLKRSKNMVLIGHKAMEGCIGESSQGKMRENGGKGGNQTSPP